MFLLVIFWWWGEKSLFAPFPQLASAGRVSLLGGLEALRLGGSEGGRV